MTATTTPPTRTADSYAKALHALLPRIKARREEIEEARRLPQDLVNDLIETGIFRGGVPKEMGGDEGSPVDLVRIVETVATADGSVGWCVAIGMTVSGVSGMMPAEGAREVYANPSLPRSIVAEPAGAAVEVEGGVRVNGRWRFASGVTHADWIGLGAIVMENGAPRMTPHGPDIIHVMVPTSEITVHDTWHVHGMRGTGSFDVSCEDVFVPNRRRFNAFAPTDQRPEPLYQMPVLAIVAPSMIAPGLGVARAALDELYELAPSKTPALSMVPLPEKPMFQVEVARLEATLGAARSFLYDTLDDMWDTVSSGQQPSRRQRALLRAACNNATEAVSHVTQRVSTLAGSSSVYNQSSIQRHARDAEMITHHMTQSPHVWEDAGRMLLGFDPLAPIF
jgi:alkylation response protein AidB-like acyl-CoA dehydrogenase